MSFTFTEVFNQNFIFKVYVVDFNMYFYEVNFCNLRCVIVMMASSSCKVFIPVSSGVKVIKKTTEKQQGYN